MSAPTIGPPARRRPRRLREGDTVAVVAPCSGVLEPSQIDRGVAVLERLGLEVVLAPGVFDVRGYLAGTDRRRADDLLWALGDPGVDAVWCARGGYGAQRTVAALDLAAVDALADRPPKPVVGFSDVTVVHALIAHRLGWVTFYGPVVTSLRRATDYTVAMLRRALFDAEPYVVGADPDDPWVTTLTPGVAEGELAGGCLTLLAALAGTPLQVDFADRICFLEDVSEPPDAIDRYLCQLLAAGCLDGVRGIALGEMAEPPPSGPSSLGFEQVFADLLAGLGVPCCHPLPIGHGTHHATLPIGVPARLDADAGTLTVVESGVVA